MDLSRRDFLKWLARIGIGASVLAVAKLADTPSLPGSASASSQWTIDNILAGRRAVDEYRAAVHIGKPKDQPSRLNRLIEQLDEQGFPTLEAFFDANKQAVKDDMVRCLVYEGECDNCKGRARGCVEACYRQRTTEIGQDKVEPSRDDSLSTLTYFADYYKTLPPRKKGRVTSMVPNCSIMNRIIEDPALKWEWQ